MSSTERPTDTSRVNATRARQGRWGFHVFLVLLVGTVLAALALFGAWAWRSGDLAESNVNNGRAGEAPAFDAPDPQAIQTPPGTNQMQQAPENAGPAPGSQVPGTAR